MEVAEAVPAHRSATHRVTHTARGALSAPRIATIGLGIRGRTGMFEIVLYEPEIPPNTGNIMRLAANTGARLHLIEPLGFVLTDRRLRRAGLDYEDKAQSLIHASFSDCERTLTDRRWFAVSTRGSRLYSDQAYRSGDVFVFGPETRGLPETVLQTFPGERIIRLPMAASSRSLNLANAVAVVVYEAWRQCRFESTATRPATGIETGTSHP